MSTELTCASRGSHPVSTDNPFWWVCVASCVTHPLYLPESDEEGAMLVPFFVAAGHSISEEQLHQCQACPVRTQCLTWAYSQDADFGFFGGLSPTTRALVPLEEMLRRIERGEA